LEHESNGWPRDANEQRHIYTSHGRFFRDEYDCDGTSNANSSVSATMQMTIFSDRASSALSRGNRHHTQTPMGIVWAASTGDNGGYFCGSGGSWPSTPDILLYESANCSYYGVTDMRYDFNVPNGSYQITAKYSGIFQFCRGTVNSLEAQGQVYFPAVDMFVYAGNKLKRSCGLRYASCRHK